MTILLVSDDDTSAFACKLLAERLRQRGESCLTVGPALSEQLHSPLPKHQPQIPIALMDLLGSTLLNDASAVGVFVKSNDQIQRFAEAHRTLARIQERRPAPLFSGPLTASSGDKLVEQLNAGLCCDLLLLPGQRQLDEVTAIARCWPHSVAMPQLLGMGLWFMPERPPIGSLHGGSRQPPHTLLALVQTSIPTQSIGKSQLLRQLISWAEVSPDWSIVIHRDYAWGKGQPWIPKFKSVDWPMPSNLVFANPGQLLTTLSTCSACLSVSSSWCFTAMAWGHPTMIVGNFGVHTDQGTTSFFGSGVMHRMQTIQHLDQMLELPPTNQQWLESMGWGIHDGTDRLVRRLKELMP